MASGTPLWDSLGVRCKTFARLEFLGLSKPHKDAIQTVSEDNPGEYLCPPKTGCSANQSLNTMTLIRPSIWKQFSNVIIDGIARLMMQ